MTKKQTLEQLKKEIAELPVNRAGCRRHYPEALKKALVAFVEKWTREGETQRSLAAKLGINYAMLSGWKRKYKARRTTSVQMRPVCVLDEQTAAAESKQMALVLPSGIRVEGLDFEGLVKLMQVLS